MRRIRLTESQLNNIIQESVIKVLNEMIAYHGASVIFDRFDLSKVHSGEGGTMYGFGIYVTTNPETGKYYANVSAENNNRNEKYLYQVKIPDDNGRNYLNIENNSEQVYGYIENGLCKIKPEASDGIKDCLEYCKDNNTLMWLFQNMCDYSFNEVELANALSKIGYVGVKVPVGYRDAGMRTI